jgi:hypothetical protein
VKNVQKVIIAVLLNGYFVIFAVFTMAYGFYWYSMQHIPDQPIAFSHRTHIQKAGMQCTNCHAFGDTGIQPGMPPVSYCMTCHVNTLPNSPEIIKLRKAYEADEPVEWIKVDRLGHKWLGGDKADQIYFPHKRHVKGGLTCQTCHGMRESMDVVYQVPPMRMGWCIACHSQKNVSQDCWTCHK